MSKFYDPSFILSKKTAWNFTLGNRNAGKSFGYKNYLLKDYFKNKDTSRHCKFAILHRKVEDVKLTSPGFFDDVLEIKYPEVTITFKAASNGFGRFYIDKEVIGYSLCIKNYVTYKKMAELQSVRNILFDEFLSEKNDYVDGEVDMIRNIYNTIARGGGEFIRNDVRMFFISNTVSMVNPYFSAFPEIKKRFKFNTKRICAENFTFEIIVNENAMKALEESEFGKSIQGTAYASYALNNQFFLDNYNFVEKVGGQKDYSFTFVLAGKEFAVYQCMSKGIVYISKSVDNTHKKIVFDTEDHDVNMLMLQRNELLIKNLSRLFQHGAVRFEDLDCKIAFLSITNLTKCSF